MSTGAWVLVVAVAAALAFGGYRAATEGRFRGTRRVGAQEAERAASRTAATTPDIAADTAGITAGSTAGNTAGVAAGQSVTLPPTDPTWDALSEALGAPERGERATLVQFSSAFCAPCRATRRVLADVAEVVPGVVHLEVDAEHHLELVRTLGIARTPTTLVLDATGGEKTRAVGAPRKEQVLQALAAD